MNALRLRTGSLLLSCLTLFETISLAMADEVRLRNGDRLRGEIVKMEGSRLTLRMSRSGDVSIDRTQV
jgi:hypothetical protein